MMSNIYDHQKPVGGLLSFRHFYTAEYRPGEDELTNYRAMKRKKHMFEATQMVCKDCGCEQNNPTPGCDCPNDNSGGPHMAPQNDDGKSTVEALTLQQRIKRGRLMKRMKSRIKIGRERAKRKMAPVAKLRRRANRKARDLIVRKITKGIPKKELTYARKQEIEKRLDKPAFKARIARLAKRMFPKIRKAEVARKKG